MEDEEHYKQSVLGYFRRKASEYDLVDNQLYWRLSDEILWRLMKINVLSKLPQQFEFLDAGCGTGRWSSKILTEYKFSRGKGIDISSEMLDVCKSKIETNGWKDRFRCEAVDLDRESDYGITADLIFSFHNVLGFVERPEIVIGNMVRNLREGGYLVSLVPNYFHNLYFNLKNNAISLWREAKDSKRGRFTIDMPSMHLFTPEMLRAIYHKNGLEIVCLTGFPCSIYPGFQETQLSGQSDSLAATLQDESSFRELVDDELRLSLDKDIAARGNQLYIVGRRVDLPSR